MEVKCTNGRMVILENYGGADRNYGCAEGKP